MIGLTKDKVAEEWKAFRAHHVAKQTQSPLAGFYALFVDSWCVRGRAFAARQPAGTRTPGPPTPAPKVADIRKRDEEYAEYQRTAVPASVALRGLVEGIGKGGGQ